MTAEPRISVLVNDTRHGVMGLRARNLTAPLHNTYQVSVHYREGSRWAALRGFTRAVLRERPHLLYVLNIAYAGGGAALFARAVRGIPVVLDHGDPVVEILRNVGRGRGERWIAHASESLMLRTADAILARGSSLAEQLREKYGDRVHFLPDGVDTSVFRPLDVAAQRKELGLEGSLTLGVVGSLVWSTAHQMCYGWDIIEGLKLLPDEPVMAVLVGDGSGLGKLKEQARAYGIEDRIVFTGRVPHEDVPRYINLMDVCVSTQSADIVGESRTTAKLPEYLACGRYIVATDVGGARQLVGENGVLLPYRGVKDPEHPARLAQTVRELLRDPSRLARGRSGVEIAKQHFEYGVLAGKLAGIVRDVLASRAGRTRVRQ